MKKPPVDTEAWRAELLPRASKEQLMTQLARLDAATVTLRNHLYTQRPIALDAGRSLVWQDSGAPLVMGHLQCSVGAVKGITNPLPPLLFLCADNLARAEPRLEGFEQSVPDEIGALLVENALHGVLGLLEHALGVPLDVDLFVRTRPVFASTAPLGDMPCSDPRLSAGFVIYDDHASPVQRGEVETTAAVWRRMAFDRLAPAPTRRQQNIPVRLSLLVGATRLRVQALRELRVGDALRSLVPIQRNTDGGLPVTLCTAAGRPLLGARIQADTLLLDPHMNSSTEFHASQANDSNAEEDLTEDIECELSFELGALSMKVSELARLRAGQTLRLGVRLREQPIRLLVNGRWIARGELAALGDELVVVVTDTSRLPHL